MIRTTEGSSSLTRPTRWNRDGGQASIEFLLTFAFGIGLSMLFVGLAMNVTRGYLVHYANFMASRTYLTHDLAATGSVERSLRAAEDRAKDIFSRYPLASFGISPELKVYSPGRQSSLMSGTTATFSERFSPFALVGGEAEAIFHSESFLAKEPVRLQCLLSICGALGLGSCGSAVDATVFDNGC